MVHDPAALGRRSFLPGAAGAAAPVPRPNIVLFYADDLDADELGCTSRVPFLPSYTAMKRLGMKPSRAYEDERMMTPHIDGLTRSGALFSRFYITSPVCTPARSSLLTGRYASRSPGFLKRYPPGGPAHIAWNTPIGPEETHLAKSLHELGYATGVVGKWHNFAARGLGERDASIGENADPREPAVARKLRERHERAVSVLLDGYGFDFADRINIGNTEQIFPAAIRG